MTLPLIAAHDAAVVAAITATGLPVDLVSKPAGAGWQGDPGNSDFAYYAIVYPLPGGSRDGSEARPFDDITLPYQVQCIGDSPGAVRQVVDLVEAALVDGGITVADRSVEPIEPADNGGVQPDDETAGPRLFYASPRYDITTRPA